MALPSEGFSSLQHGPPLLHVVALRWGSGSHSPVLYVACREKAERADVDAAAMMLCPELTDASKNRKVYTPVSAIMHHAGFETLLLEGDKRKTMKRPKGARGRSRLCWLRPPEAARLIAAARARAERLEAEIETGGPRQFRGARKAAAKAARCFTALCVFLLFTGCRLTETLRIKPADAELQRSFVFCGKTKNGDPRPVHLPPQVVAELANIKFGRPVRLHRQVRAPLRVAEGGCDGGRCQDPRPGGLPRLPPHLRGVEAPLRRS
jgi:integrase